MDPTDKPTVAKTGGLKVINLRKNLPPTKSPKDAVIYILEDFIEQLRKEETPDPEYMVLFTDEGLATYKIANQLEYLGALQLEMMTFFTERVGADE